MSHFSRIKTRIVEKEHLLAALRDLNYAPQEGEVSVRGWGGQTTPAEIKVATKNKGYDIGFRKKDGCYEIVADWFGVKGVSQKAFVQQVNQRYAYHVARAKLEAQGFSVAGEEVDDKGRIRLVLRRLA